jgi:hypothetical protein
MIMIIMISDDDVHDDDVHDDDDGDDLNWVW